MEDFRTDYLKKIDKLIGQGEYKDNWESLAKYPGNSWFAESKFGIFIHWGVYSVPAYGSEWYSRNMYLKGSREYDHHIKTYGEHKDFGYADFIPLFKAEKFDASRWMKLFAESGARYVMPVAEHHDGFQMYDSALSEWNAVKMGPKRDVLGELKQAAEKEGLLFCASSHRAENFWFFGGGRTFDSGIKDIEYQEPYGFADPMYSFPEQAPGTHNIYSEPPSKEHLDDWLVRTCELVDSYRPRAVYFDWWIQNLGFKPYLKKFAAYYYNRSREWGLPVMINYKFDAYARNTAVFDMERGQLEGINPLPWQTDTAIAKNSWGYTANNEFKSPEEILALLVDIVSKNGNLLLNVGPRSDGTITDEEINVLKEIGRWLKMNGEGIYGTDHWALFGEGPVRAKGGSFSEGDVPEYTERDIRFTYKAPYLYAFVLKWPKSNKVCIKSLKLASPPMGGHVVKVELLGYDMKVYKKREEGGLTLSLDGKIETPYPVCFKIELN